MHLALSFPLLLLAFSSCSPLQQQPQIRPCSFTDEMSNFYASWHTNCSGLVNFVVNAYNFPRPKVPLANGLLGFSPYANFWIGIGIHLVSTELIMVESQPNGGVLVSQARIEPNRPPQRQIGQGILLNPRGSFFGTTLEATFSIDESLLRGCKEFMFFTTPMPLDVPFAGLPSPHIREICELGRMCAISPCSPGKAMGKQQKRSVAFGGAGLGGPVGMMDFIGTGSPQDPTLSMTMMNDIGTMNPAMMSGYGSKFGPTNYGAYPNAMMMDASRPNGGFGYGQYGRGYEAIPLEQQQALLVAVFTTLNLTNQTKKQLGTVADSRPNGTVSRPPLPTVVAFPKRRLRRQSSGKMFADFAHEHGTTLKGTAYEGQDKQFHRVEPVVSALNPQYEALARYQAKQGLLRPNDQLIGQHDFDQAAGVYWPYRTTIGTADVQGAPQGMRIAPASSNIGNGDEVMPLPSAGQLGIESPLMEPPTAQNFYVPEKCDFGTDPQWCGDYVQQFVKWFEQYGSRGKTMCFYLMESLKNSDHRCCNALKKLNC